MGDASSLLAPSAAGTAMDCLKPGRVALAGVNVKSSSHCPQDGEGASVLKLLAFRVCEKSVPLKTRVRRSGNPTPATTIAVIRASELDEEATTPHTHSDTRNR